MELESPNEMNPWQPSVNLVFRAQLAYRWYMSHFLFPLQMPLTSACLWTIPQASRPVSLKQGNSYEQPSFSTNQITLTRSSHLKKRRVPRLLELNLEHISILSELCSCQERASNLLSGIISGLRELSFSTQQLVGTHVSHQWNDLSHWVELLGFNRHLSGFLKNHKQRLISIMFFLFPFFVSNCFIPVVVHSIFPTGFSHVVCLGIGRGSINQLVMILFLCTCVPVPLWHKFYLIN